MLRVYLVWCQSGNKPCFWYVFSLFLIIHVSDIYITNVPCKNFTNLYHNFYSNSSSNQLVSKHYSIIKLPLLNSNHPGYTWLWTYGLCILSNFFSLPDLHVFLLVFVNFTTSDLKLLSYLLVFPIIHITMFISAIQIICVVVVLIVWNIVVSIVKCQHLQYYNFVCVCVKFFACELCSIHIKVWLLYIHKLSIGLWLIKKTNSFKKHKVKKYVANYFFFNFSYICISLLKKYCLNVDNENYKTIAEEICPVVQTKHF